MTKVIVTSAVKLTSSQVASIKDSLTKKVDDSIEIETVVNPEVLGGVSITVGSNHYDATYRYRLEQIKKALINHSDI